MISACRGLHRSELVHSVDVLTVRWPFDLWWMWGDAGWRQGIQITSGGKHYPAFSWLSLPPIPRIGSRF